ncbi:type II secretion system protein GspC [Vibrio taketomensis]|uniref:type II secretion system protein GspC n=1 Tax=Vibrio taketomensis TaxID=2572923 RepID=UPI001E6196C4|nr:type II secretion system protein GspC [Vibrio taketomensis]
MKSLHSSSLILQKLMTHQTRLSALVTCILLLLTAWVLGRFIWFPYQTSAVAPWQPNTTSNTASAEPQLDLAGLYNSHLFGEYKAPVTVVEQPKLQDAPKSRLNIVLVGVVTSSDPQKSLAVISQSGKQATYGVNETFEGSRVKLVQVQADRIIVDNAGRNETVMLEGLKYTSPKPSQSVTTRDVSPAQLEQIRNEIAAEPSKIFQYVQMSKYEVDGKIEGYRLRPGKSRVLYDSVGLKDGDLATHLNGQDLRDPAAMTQLMAILQDLTELNLTVERDGQPYDIYIAL